MNAVIYHWWNDSIHDVKNDLFNPVIFSIASIRRQDESCAIYVIDLSKEEKNWSNYPAQLNFQVIKKTCRFNPHPKYNEHSMSRIWDISDVADSIKETHILFNDADVFWLKPPFPLVNPLNKFNCNRNNGVFYFSKEEKNVRAFIEMWKKRNELVMTDLEYRESFYKRIKFPTGFKTHDELVVRTVLEDHPELSETISAEENAIVCTPSDRCKNIHLIRAFAGSENRLAALMSIKEFRDMAFAMLGEKFEGPSFMASQIINKENIKHLCSFGGNYQKSIDYGASKLC